MPARKEMPQKKPRQALLIENRPELRDLEKLLLNALRLRVATPPAGMDPVTYAAQIHPDVVIIHIETTGPPEPSLIDRFNDNPITQTIPIVAIATSESIAAEAQAGPNVPVSVVAPYDISAFEHAVTTALGLPPPAAMLPASGPSVPGYVAFAADHLLRKARIISLQTVHALLHTEPYQSRFTELTPGLVDSMGMIIGALIDGLRRGLTPEQVFTTPEVDRLITGHVRLRHRQGVGIASVLREDVQLEAEINQLLQGLIGQPSFTADDAFKVSLDVHAFIGKLIEITGAKYQAASEGSGGARGEDHPSSPR